MDLRNADGERLAHTWSGDPAARRVAIIGHGLTSQHDRPWLVAVSDALARRDIASLRFSFAGNGASEGRFEEATITKEVGDLGAVLDAVGDRFTAYVGHSMGAAVGVLRAARDPRIRALVSLAGMVHVSEFVQRLFGHLTPGRDVMLDKPHCPLGQHFLDDARRVHSVLDAGQEVRAPWLLVHGTADDIVPAQDARDMATATGAELIELDGIDHRFSGVQQAVAGRVAAWLDRRLPGA